MYDHYECSFHHNSHVSLSQFFDHRISEPSTVLHPHCTYIFIHVGFSMGGVAEGILLITRKKRRWSRTGFLNCPRTVQKKPMGHNESPRSIAGLNGGWHDDDNIGCQPAIPRENKCLQKGAGSHARAAYTVFIQWCVCMKLVTRLLEKTDPYIESSAFNLFTSLPSRDLYLFSYQVSD